MINNIYNTSLAYILNKNDINFIHTSAILYSDVQSEGIRKNLNSGLFLIFRSINNKIPSWLKLLFKLFFISLIILKIIGFHVAVTIFSNVYYLKLLSYFACLLGIIFQLLHILLIYIFSIKKRNIPEILPDSVINWLKEFEIICESKEGIKEFKNLYYREILVYVFLILLIILLL